MEYRKDVGLHVVAARLPHAWPANTNLQAHALVPMPPCTQNICFVIRHVPHMITETLTYLIDFNELAHSAVCYFQRVEAEQAICVDLIAAAAKRPPLLCQLHWHVQLQLVEINHLHLVEIHEPSNVPTR